MSDAGKPTKRIDTRKRRAPEIVRPTAPNQDSSDNSRSFERNGGGNLYVGGARGEFGTRVAKRVECGRCGKSDHVPYVPKDKSRALCRDCAALVLRAYEVGTKVPTETRPETCNLCGTPFRIPLSVPDDGDPLCPSCLRGFTTWSGTIDTPFEERQRQVVETRDNPSVVVRKTRDKR